MSTAINADSAAAGAQQNFQPSWMKSAFHGNGGGGTGDGTPRSFEDLATDSSKSGEFSYSRAQLITLAEQELTGSPPEGIMEAVLHANVANGPVVKKPLTPREEQHANNVNSWKAMSTMTPEERTRLYNGGEHQMTLPTRGASGWARGSGWGRGGSTPERGRGGSTQRGGLLRGSGRGLSTEGENGGSNATPTPFFSWRTGKGSGTTPTRNPGVIGSKDKPASNEEMGDGNASDDEGGWTQAGKNKNTKRQTSTEWVAARKKENSPWTRESKVTSAGGDSNSSPSSNVWRDRAAMIQSFNQDSQSRGSVEPEDDALKSTSTYTAKTTDSGRDITSETSSFGTTTSDTVSSSISQSTVAAPPQDLLSSASRPLSTNNSSLPWPGMPGLDLTGLSAALPPTPQVPLMQDNMLLELQKQQQMIIEFQKQQMLAAALATQQRQVPVEPLVEPKWLYVDPNEQEQGPFEKEQMAKWYEAGYFEDESLRVRRDIDKNYSTIGELKKNNGLKTPFDVPKPIIPPFSSAAYNPLGGSLMSGSTMWGNTLPDSMSLSSILEAERRKFDEEKKREQENYRRIMLEELERERQANQLKMLEHEKKVQEQVEALKRHEMEVNQKATLIQEMMRQKNALEEKQQELERQRRLEAERVQKEMEEVKAKEEELRRKNREAELQKQQEAERRAYELQKLDELKKQEEASLLAKRRAAESEERKRQEQIAADQARAKAIAAAEKKKGFELTTAWDAAPRQKVEPLPASASTSDDADEWTQVASQKVKKTGGAAPWATQRSSTEKSLREIQEEEERQLRQQQSEELKKREKLKLESAAVGAQLPRPPVWTPLAGLVGTVDKPKPTGKTVWNVANNASQSPNTHISPLLDGPSLAAANKIVQQPAQVKKPAPKPTQVTPAKSKETPTKDNTQQNAEFKNWFVKKYSQISKTDVDTGSIEVLFNFISEVKPSEVENYLMSYLDESKAVKEFVREFVQRRIELKSRASQEVDDLTSARTAATPQSQPGKKKKKNQKVVLDGACLGFRPAPASNRINQGEIETVPLPAGVKRA